MLTCRASTSDSQVSGYVVGYNIKWEEEYKWLVPYRDEVGVITECFVSCVSGTSRISTTILLYGMRPLVFAYVRIVYIGTA